MDLIDTHLHLIDARWSPLAWTEAVEPLRGRDFLVDEARRLYGGHVRGSIFMEVDADDFRAESRGVAALVRDGSLLGQIANCRPEADAGFADWLAEAKDLGVVGFRRMLHTVPEDVSLPESFRANVRAIGAAGYPFDVNVFGRTLWIARDLARACEGVTMVLDHCGTPDIAGGGWEEWSAGLAEVAACPNMNVKLSGLTAYARPDQRDEATLRPWIDRVIELFGPSRMIWGSDWPVANLGAGLPGWLAITEATLSRLSPDEAVAISRLNAERIYDVRAL